MKVTQKGIKMSTKCRHCGSTSYGSGCYHSPTKKHEHRDDEKHCEWCGSTSYGSGCYHSPTKKHRHGPGGNKCIWCGSTSNGSGCYHSPTGKHEKWLGGNGDVFEKWLCFDVTMVKVMFDLVLSLSFWGWKGYKQQEVKYADMWSDSRKVGKYTSGKWWNCWVLRVRCTV